MKYILLLFLPALFGSLSIGLSQLGIFYWLFFASVLLGGLLVAIRFEMRPREGDDRKFPSEKRREELYAEIRRWKPHDK